VTRTVRVVLNRYSAEVSGPRLRPALDRSACRWHWHPHHHKAVVVHRDDLDDLLVVLELDSQRVELLDRAGRPVLYGGLFGGAA